MLAFCEAACLDGLPYKPRKGPSALGKRCWVTSEAAWDSCALMVNVGFPCVRLLCRGTSRPLEYCAELHLRLLGPRLGLGAAVLVWKPAKFGPRHQIWSGSSYLDTPVLVWEQLETRPELVRNWSGSKLVWELRTCSLVRDWLGGPPAAGGVLQGGPKYVTEFKVYT